ncbi:sugar ABC transporter substrate-binding protein [Marasmitruncus massiliensis]|uniref:sugar ABC transporter substrate-binding protein n=1 Tax=Marasmitruncus massiliensis TaxID=1944642 RepID=UPI000C7C7CDB|nr:sugar ABC transporter substrate-binding protein [Marasmitruncus massiliensis]
MKKKALSMLLATAILLSLAGCGGSAAPASKSSSVSQEESSSTAASTDTSAASGEVVMVGTEGSISAEKFGYEVIPNRKYTIAVVTKSAAIPVWESHIIAAQKAGEEIGVEVLDYSPTKADNVEEQKRILEDLITTGVDAVVLAPANTEAVKGPVQDLIDAGIPVIYDNTMGPSDVDYLTYVGIDNELVGRMIANEITKMIGQEGKVVVMEGVPGQATSDLRTAACLEEFAAYPNIEVESGVTKWQADEGRKLAEDYITKWGDSLSALVAVGGNQAEGAVEAVKAAGLEGKVLVSGFDVQEPQYAAVSNGAEAFTVSQGVYEQAYLSVVAAVRALNGEEVPRQINCPITIVNQDNLEKMDERPDALRSR